MTHQTRILASLFVFCCGIGISTFFMENMGSGTHMLSSNAFNTKGMSVAERLMNMKNITNKQNVSFTTQKAVRQAPKSDLYLAERVEDLEKEVRMIKATLETLLKNNATLPADSEASEPETLSETIKTEIDHVSVQHPRSWEALSDEMAIILQSPKENENDIKRESISIQRAELPKGDEKTTQDILEQMKQTFMAVFEESAFEPVSNTLIDGRLFETTRVTSTLEGEVVVSNIYLFREGRAMFTIITSATDQSEDRFREIFSEILASVRIF